MKLYVFRIFNLEFGALARTKKLSEPYWHEFWIITSGRFSLRPLAGKGFTLAETLQDAPKTLLKRSQDTFPRRSQDVPKTLPRRSCVWSRKTWGWGLGGVGGHLGPFGVKRVANQIFGHCLGRGWVWVQYFAGWYRRFENVLLNLTPLPLAHARLANKNDTLKRHFFFVFAPFLVIFF